MIEQKSKLGVGATKEISNLGIPSLSIYLFSPAWHCLPTPTSPIKTTAEKRESALCIQLDNCRSLHNPHHRQPHTISLSHHLSHTNTPVHIRRKFNCRLQALCFLSVSLLSPSLVPLPDRPQATYTRNLSTNIHTHTFRSANSFRFCSRQSSQQ